jgi:hypothetical protein
MLRSLRRVNQQRRKKISFIHKKVFVREARVFLISIAKFMAQLHQHTMGGEKKIGFIIKVSRQLCRKMGNKTKGGEEERKIFN